MNLFNNRYNQAQVWKNAMEVREFKKQALQPVTETQETVAETHYNAEQYTKMFFRHTDIGHTDKETQKIQAIYNELRQLLFFSPVARFS